MFRRERGESDVLAEEAGTADQSQDRVTLVPDGPAGDADAGSARLAFAGIPHEQAVGRDGHLALDASGWPFDRGSDGKGLYGHLVPQAAAGPATHSTGRSPRIGDVPPTCPRYGGPDVPPQVRAMDGG